MPVSAIYHAWPFSFCSCLFLIPGLLTSPRPTQQQRRQQTVSPPAPHCAWSQTVLHQALPQPMAFQLPPCSLLQQTPLWKPGRRGGRRLLPQLQDTALRKETEKWGSRVWPKLKEILILLLSYILGGFCGWWRLALCCVYSQSLPPTCLITDRRIFAFCDGELKAQRKILWFVLSFLWSLCAAKEYCDKMLKEAVLGAREAVLGT